MPYDRHYEPEEPWVVTRFYGRIEDGDMVAAFRQYDPRLDRRPGFRELMDCRGVRDVSEVSSAGMLAIANLERERSTPKGGKLAVLTKEPLQRGMTNMFIAMVGPSNHELRCFTDEDEALRWLGLGSAATRIRALLARPHETKPAGRKQARHS